MKRRVLFSVGSKAVVASTLSAMVASRPRLFAQQAKRWRMVTFLPLRPLFAEFAQLVEEASQGRLVLEITAAEGDADPAKVLDDVRSGRIELGWGPFLVRSGQVPAARFLNIPFGLTPKNTAHG